jgi:hypothetical protein
MSNSNVLEIDPRPGFKVFVNHDRRIVIEQISEQRWEEEDIVVISPDDVPALVSMLGVMCQAVREGSRTCDSILQSQK